MDKYKKLLPPELKYPLPDKVLDNLLDKKALFAESCAYDICLLAALIELKERREKDGKEG